MVLEAGMPFKVTLHNPTQDVKRVLSMPMVMDAVLPPGAAVSLESGTVHRHFFDINIPTASDVSGVEVDSAVLVLKRRADGTPGGTTVITPADAQAALTDDDAGGPGVAVNLMLQLLDGKSRPSGLPFVVASNCTAASLSADGRGCDTSMPLGVSLTNSQRVRVIVVQRSMGEVPHYVSAVRLLCRVIQLYGHTKLASTKAIEQVNMNLKRCFVMAAYDVCNPRLVAAASLTLPTGPAPAAPQATAARIHPGRPARSRTVSLKRPRATSPQAAQQLLRAETAETAEGSENDSPPDLRYAFVPGGPSDS